MNPNPTNPSESFPHEAISPEMLAWARQTFDEEEFLADIREIEATGGVQLNDFLDELKTRARPQ